MKKITLNLTDIVRGKDSRGREATQAHETMLGFIMPEFLKELLSYTKGNKSHAARVSGLHRDTLNRQLKKHGIAVEKQITHEGGES